MTDLHVPDTDEPDFESLYEPHVDGDGWRMTPRTASHLWGAATILGDEWRTCITDPELLAENLPPVARPYAQNRSWLEQFIEGFDRLARRLCGDGDSDCLARCTAEELALHLTINTAEACGGSNKSAGARRGQRRATRMSVTVSAPRSSWCSTSTSNERAKCCNEGKSLAPSPWIRRRT